MSTATATTGPHPTPDGRGEHSPGDHDHGDHTHGHHKSGRDDHGGHDHGPDDGGQHRPNTGTQLQAAFAEAAPRGGPVLLDIGGDIGAVIAHLDDEYEGTELPILSLDDPAWDPNTHTGVWRRSINGGSVVVAVYHELQHGRYRIVVPAGPTSEFAVVGGQVTQIDLTTGGN